MRNYLAFAYTFFLVVGLATFSAGRAYAAGAENTSEVSDTVSYMKARQLLLDGELEQAAELLEKVRKHDPDSPEVTQQLAEAYLRLGRLEKAEELARKLIEKDPKNASYHSSLAEVLTEAKRYPEAKDEYAKVLEIDPEDKRAPLYIGMLQTETTDYDGAVTTFTKAIDKNSENLMAFYYRARVHLLRDDHAAAKKDLAKCLVLRPNFVEAGTVLGMLHEKLGEIDEASQVYASIQGNGRFRKRLAQLYQQKGEMEKALAELLEYEKLEADDFTAKVRIGIYYLELKQWDKAVQRFQDLLKEHPTADNVRFYLGVVHMEQKRLDKALKEFRRIGNDSAFYREAMVQAALILREQGKKAEGTAFAKSLTKKHPEIPEFFDLHASFLEQAKDYLGALKVIDAALKRHATDERLLYFRGVLLERAGKRDEAIAAMKKVLELNDKSPHALNFIGYTYAERGEKLDEAESMIRRALELRPTDGFIEDSLGWVLFQRGKVDEAEKHLLHAAELQPAEAVIQDHLGEIYAKRGDKEKARECFEKAQKLSAGDAVMAKKLKEKLAILTRESSR